MKFTLTRQNAAIVAVDKPAGMLSVASRMPDQDPRPCLHTELEKVLGQKIWPVHRLDFEVSGLILFAKTPDAHRAASMAFESRAVRKFYEAFTAGMAPPTPEARWESKILRGKKRAYETPHGKSSITLAHYLGERTVANTTALHWEIEPLTGRGHQIRFHLSHNGYPIVGDSLYGSKIAIRADTIALRARKLEFTDPSAAAAMGLQPNESLAVPALELET
ncbi:MAG: RluA family pseudouridine synthase [Bacteriovoracia bacterium]